jgi:glycine cleavage system T protein (aminomethyltransferase)
VELKRTPLHAAHAAAGGRLVPFSGWEMPLQYSSIKEEQLAVRHAAGAFDVSHMGRYELAGAGAEASLQRILTNDVAALDVGRAVYSLICRDDGGIVDDVIAYKRSPELFSVVVNAGNREKDWQWIEAHLEAGVELRDRSDELALIAFQGPRAAELLDAGELATLASFGFVEDLEVQGIRCALIARTGYTGEDGFELMVPAESAVELWNRLLALDPAVRPCGLGARDVCRLEAGLRLYGNDMDDSVNPYEAGLGWTVKLDKGEFVGQAKLAAIKASGPARTTLGVRGEGRAIPRHGTPVRAGGAEVGEVTSGTWSFLLEQGIGMARVAAGRVQVGDRVELELRGQPAAAEVVKLPFYRAPARDADSSKS